MPHWVTAIAFVPVLVESLRHWRVTISIEQR
jgi:hypothetical protein